MLFPELLSGGMMLTDQDKNTLKATVELLWKKGCHHPQEAAIAYQFTQLVEKLLKPVAEEKKETTGS